MSWRTIKLKQVLKQYRIENIVQNDKEYKQVTISKHDGVKYRGIKNGKEIGRKRQFLIDLKEYPNTLMFVRQGVYEGAIGIAPLEVDGCIVTENMPMFSVEGIEVDYIKLLLKSSFFKDELGKIPTAGSAQKSIHERQILEIEIPYPDKQEQLNIINSYRNNKIKIENISSIINHQLDLVKQLRNAFLREAMQGKLTVKWREKNQNVEPASELLKRIKTEKEILVKEGKLKKQKPLPPIKEDEIPFEIPESWEWCRLSDLCNIKSGKRIHAADYKKDGIPFLRSGEIGTLGRGEQIVNPLYISKEKYNEIKAKFGIPKAGDILIACIGGSIGNTWVVDEREFYFKDGNLVLIESNEYINNGFLLYYLKSPFFWSNTILNATDSSYNALTIIKLNDAEFPLPEITEQKQLVTKLDELMRYCDKLEESIKTCQQQNEMLLQQVLREALEPKNILQIKKCNASEKAILGGHIIHKANKKDFGRVKLMKLLHLTEYNCKIDLDSNFIQNVAGPHDEYLIKEIEATLIRYRIFSIKQEKSESKKVTYTPLAASSELDTMFFNSFKNESGRIDDFLEKFTNFTYKECEIISTLYAVWNNRIIGNKEINDSLLKQDFINWDKQKIKYKDRLDGAISWMKKEGVVPDGWGKMIEKP